MLYRRFEQLIDIFRAAPSDAPPDKVLPFYLYYLRQVWPSFAALLVVGLIGALIEVALFSYLSRIIDLAQGTPPANFFQIHSAELIWMAVVALLLRPIFNGLHDLLVHQTINPGMTSLIRWQNHSYVLKQSLNFFQNDFAGVSPSASCKPATPCVTRRWRRRKPSGTCRSMRSAPWCCLPRPTGG